jgi:Oligosaccharide biosynthesis protein Alg14 like
VRKILAIASGGGHWIQLYRMRPAWDGCQITYASTMAGLADSLCADAKTRGQAVPAYVLLPEANRWQKIRLVWLLVRTLTLLVWLRPDVIVTTGAAHGYFALRIGRWLGAKTVWIDSIANADELSLSGKRVGPFADVWLTQWEHLARPEGPGFQGAVL